MFFFFEIKAKLKSFQKNMPHIEQKLKIYIIYKKIKILV